MIVTFVFKKKLDVEIVTALDLFSFACKMLFSRMLRDQIHRGIEQPLLFAASHSRGTRPQCYYPSLKPTLTLNSPLGQNVVLGEG